ncbi:DUF6114 domain-containing protein, partial [Actinoplanes sp. NPDC020271]|uniref:DUF6114 domain-containing protein n=1 Tax=Actinoplanes sp. NPDC020271 TaxID=3363896 RepID=UPI00379C2667
MATDDFWGKFRRWRRGRPFWGGLFLLLSGLFLLLSSNLSVFTDMTVEIHIGPQGFLSYVLPVLMFVAGILVWVTPVQRLFYGIIGLLTALYSFIGLNFGGWGLGMIFGIVGGALAVSWAPPPTTPGTPTHDAPDVSGPPRYSPPANGQPQAGPGETTQVIQVAGHDDRPHQPAPAVSDPSILPGFEGPRSAAPAEPEGPREDLPGPRRGLNRKALAIIMVPAFVGGTFLIGSRLPASADDECPAGLPSITTSVTSKSAGASACAAAPGGGGGPAAPPPPAPGPPGPAPRPPTPPGPHPPPAAP